MSVRKWLWLSFGNRDGAYRLPIAKQRNCEHGPPSSGQRPFARVLRVVEHVGDVYDCAVQYGAATEVRTIWPLLLTKFHSSSRRLGREVVGSCNMDMIVLVQINSAENGTTQARGALDDRVKYWLGICR